MTPAPAVGASESDPVGVLTLAVLCIVSHQMGLLGVVLRPLVTSFRYTGDRSEDATRLPPGVVATSLGLGVCEK
mgnify:CR=1 FL=1